jgi:pyruvate-formate lyase
MNNMDTKGNTRREFFLKSIQASAFILFYQNTMADSLFSNQTLKDDIFKTEGSSYISSANDMVEMIENFTNTYKKYTDDHYLREVHCIRVQWKAWMRRIQPNDLLVGASTQAPIGFVPQSDEGGLGYFLHIGAVGRLLNDPALSAENRTKLNDLIDFWEKRNTVQLSKNTFDAEMKKVLTQEEYWAEPGIAFILWRMSGVQMDYEKLVRLGIPGLRSEIIGYQDKTALESDSYRLYDAMLQSLDTFSEIAFFYADDIKSQLLSEKDAKRIVDLKIMEAILRKLPTQKPESLREGMQLVFLYNAIDGARNYGRLDEALGTLYANDFKSGRIDEEEAVRLFSSMWNLIARRNYRYDSRIIIGGRGRVNEQAADKVALVMIETTRRVKDIVPQLALRFFNGQNPELYKKALDTISEGNPFPMLYNDDVNIPSAMKAFDLPFEEAQHVIQYGCGEYVMNHRSVGTPSAVINLLQAVNVTLFKGYDPLTNQPNGMPLSRFSKYGNQCRLVKRNVYII